MLVFQPHEIVFFSQQFFWWSDNHETIVFTPMSYEVFHGFPVKSPMNSLGKWWYHRVNLGGTWEADSNSCLSQGEVDRNEGN